MCISGVLQLFDVYILNQSSDITSIVLYHPLSITLLVFLSTLYTNMSFSLVVLIAILEVCELI